ncbi:IclR family transcriptional regulator [Janthinobacterium sp. 17J80-10]|uniref:IclR family transcriptional regulator n=1 Tax=Janthinobacterium sp. 17J80-10 TaxID=2497863 RepID=UPI00100529B6|nr:IclR family transcriptional regulator [Janthinobacterium sp. 17J80-10]QAU33760.1 IclR family transcriptional regulator [Janthinobacterium sp. 17J80-10]
MKSVTARSLATLAASDDAVPQEKSTSPAVTRAARVLDTLAGSANPLSLADLARMVDLPKSSLHGLCATLVQLRLITRLENGQMSLGPHVMTWANAFLARSDITQEFYAAWEEIGELPQETVTLSVMDGASVVYVACRNGSRPLGVTFRIGMRLPLAFTATGKAMASTFALEDVKASLQGSWPQKLTPAGTPDLEAFLAQLDEVRRRGYSVDAGEVREGMHCFGAPVFDSSGSQAVAGVAVSMLSIDATEAAQEKAGAAIRRFADRLSARLGGRPAALRS